MASRLAHESGSRLPQSKAAYVWGAWKAPALRFFLEAFGEVVGGGTAGLAWLALLEGGLLDSVLQLAFVSAGI